MVSRRMPVSRSIRRSDHPSRPNAMTCCFFSSLKKLLTVTEDSVLTPAFNVLDDGLQLAGFQVTLTGRFWVTLEAAGYSPDQSDTPRSDIYDPWRTESHRHQWRESAPGLDASAPSRPDRLPLHAPDPRRCEILRRPLSTTACAPNVPRNAYKPWSRSASPCPTALLRPPPRTSCSRPVSCNRPERPDSPRSR